MFLARGSGLFLLVLYVCLANAYECDISRKRCVFHFDVDFGITMMDGNVKVFAENGNLYRYDVVNTSNAEPLNGKNIISADGWEEPRLLTIVNNKFPGPKIIVYEGQTIVVRVKNHLESHGVTIHWHGMHQKGTPWMDGVPFVNQCPIVHGQTFEYKFTPEQTGTYWWHSHIGTQRTNGLYGALIIRKKHQKDENEHIMIIQDWNHDGDSDLTTERAKKGGGRMYDGRELVSGFRDYSGAGFGNIANSALINGKGRYKDKNGAIIKAPLTIFKVTQGESYRFRVISAGSIYPFRVSVDGHELSLVASDGFDLEPYSAESFIIMPGERYDFIIKANKPIGNYWVRAELFAANENVPVAEAILRYKGADSSDPTSNKASCTRSKPCIIANCPYPYFPQKHVYCKTLNDLKAGTESPAPRFDETSRNYFLNFGFPGTTWRPASVNGRTFQSPPVNALAQPKDWYLPCDSPQCGNNKICQCTHALKFNGMDGKRTIQMVISTLGTGGTRVPHPIHIHGHSFHVIKQGFGQYNETTAQFISPNTDIDCRGSFCNNAKWANKDWASGNIPGAELKRAPIKDTVILPGGGYVVIRFKADNPGIWLVHCHMEMHNVLGMKFVLNETFSQMPKVPDDLPRCYSYPRSLTQPQSTGLQNDGGDFGFSLL